MEHRHRPSHRGDGASAALSAAAQGRGDLASRVRRRALAALALVWASGCGFFQVGETETLCNLVTHAPCASSEACISPAAPHCAPAGTKTAGAACTLDDECTRDTICLGQTGAKVCQPRCDLAKPACDEGLLCIQGEVVATDDGFGVCTKFACNPFDGTGCPSGERCIPGALPYCTAVIGVGGGGQTCTVPEACKSGAICATDSAKGDKYCLPLCSVDGDPAVAVCGEDFSCQSLVDGNGNKLPGGQGYCRRERCNSLTNEGCKDSEKCYPATQPVCAFPGNGGLLSACTKVDDCGKDLICLQDAKGERLCRQVCDFSGADAAHGCPSDQECGEILTGEGKPPLPNHIGYCRPKS